MKKRRRPVFAEAVERYWKIRNQQAREQKERGVTDTGSRSDVVGGKQMDGFSDKIVSLLKETGINESDIHIKSRNQLPGYYRPHKGWDTVITQDDKLLAAIEFKSQVGPSFGNNFNNRVEEALGSAEDFWTAHRKGAYGESKPWLGYLFLLEDCPATHQTRGLRQPHFKALPEYEKTSYAKRYEILLRKLVQEEKYTSACLLLSDPENYQDASNYSEPAPDLSAEQFIKQLRNHIENNLS